jgi:beta-phosphoglucomutase-like phosphatase (HAD superfamily)
MLKAIIFDMDGVIFDSELIHTSIEVNLFNKLGIYLSKEKHNEYVGTTSYYMWNDLKAKYRLTTIVNELVENERNEFYKYLCDNNIVGAIIDGVGELIVNIFNSNLKLAVASSSPINVIEKVMNIFDLDGYFNTLVTGDYVTESKPKPDIFLYAAEKLGVKPEECLVIEDSHNGVIGAKAAGMKCIGYINKNSGNQNLLNADLIVDNFNIINIEKLHKLFIE